MSGKAKDAALGSHWMLRCAYIFALTGFMAVIVYFYHTSSELTKREDLFRDLHNKLAVLNEKLDPLIVKSGRYVEAFEDYKNATPYQAELRSLSFKERKEFLKNLPADTDILGPQNSLTYYNDIAADALNDVKESFGRLSEQEQAGLLVNLRFQHENPFKDYESLLSGDRISAIRTKKDLYWTANQLIGVYDGNIRPQFNGMHVALRETLDEQAALHGKLLSNFLWIAAGLVWILALCVFIPVDLFMKKMLRRLSRERARAESADRAKSEFLANMSHEIRTPMNGVMGMAELLSATNLNAKQAMFADVILKSGTALLTIINDILDFSKIDAGQMELDPAPFKLGEAIEDVATLVSTKVAEKNLELIVRVEPGLPQCLVGDVGRIRQIVTNLMGNAVKFTEKGHVFVDVNGKVSEKNGVSVASLRIAVEDTGIGIPDEDLQKVFEKFSQVDTSATRKHEGTGLGLSIASSLVDLMGGKIGAESKPGEGSTFWFEIDLPVHGEAENIRKTPIDVTGSRILIVDDNEVNRSILTEQMTSWKFESAAAVSGAEAIAFLKAATTSGMTIDCIVMDYHMPDMNGGDTVKAIKADDTIPDVPIIMLTSVDETADGKAFSSLGIQGHLTKPTRSSLLLETLISVLQYNTPADLEADEENRQAVSMVRQLAQETSTPEPTALDEPVVPMPMPVATPREAGAVEVLICEDNEVNQILFRQVLDDAGISFSIANNGQEGVKVYEHLSPKLILMDVSMPVMNGHDATREIRKLEAKSGLHTPIIGVTANALKGDREACLEAGMDDYLSKPISPQALTEKLNKWLRHSEKRRSA